MMGHEAARLVPPAIADERGKAFGSVMAQALDEPDFARFLFERIDDVDAAFLPHLVREFSIEEFVEPGMGEAMIRRLLKGSYELHARKGFIDGVRQGLAMLGVPVIGWRQWFQDNPKAAPGTHIAIVRVDDEVFAAEGQAITSRLHRAVERMVAGMKRHSQYLAIRYVTGATMPVHVGAIIRTRLVIRPNLERITQIVGVPRVFIGAAVRTRLRIIPQL
jgi:phage tail P2-like protein